MEMNANTTTALKSNSGRWLLFFGSGLFVLGLALYAVQFSLSRFFVPWYVPIAGTVGALLVGASLFKRRTVTRFLVLIVLALLCAGEWGFLLSASRLPSYSGPGEVPAFAARRAQGEEFTDKDLRQGTRTALIFFRGRW